MDKTQKSVKYSFTVTLKPNLYKYIAEEQFSRTYIALSIHLCKLSPNVTVLAELTKSMNIHYHGIIQFNIDRAEVNLRKKFIDSFRTSKEFGFVNIKQIEDEAGWIKYITKDLDQSRLLIGSPPILLDRLELLGDVQTFNFQYIQDEQ